MARPRHLCEKTTWPPACFTFTISKKDSDRRGTAPLIADFLLSFSFFLNPISRLRDLIIQEQ